MTALLQAHEAPLRGPVHAGTRPREHFAPARGGASRGGRVPDPWASWGLACAVWGLPPLPCVCSRGSAHVHGRGAGYVHEGRERDEVSSAAGREHPAPAVTGRGAPRKGPGAARRRPRTEAPLWGLALGSGCLLRGRRSVEPHVLAGAWPLWTHRSSGCPSVWPAEPTSSWGRDAEGRGWAGCPAAPAPARMGGGPAPASLGSCAFSVPVRGGGGGEVTGSHLWLQMRPRAARHPSLGGGLVSSRGPQPLGTGTGAPMRV